MTTPIENDFADILGPITPPRASSRSKQAGGTTKTPRFDTLRLTESDLATFWGRTARQVQKLVSEAVLEKGADGRFDASDATQRYIHRLAISAKTRSTATPELQAEKLRVTKAQADQIELKNAEKRGEMVSAAAVKSAWAEMLRDVRAAMLAVPSRVLQRLPHLSAHDLDQIDREIRNALQETADDEHA